METNNILAAPQISGLDDKIIEAWKSSVFGRFKTEEDFYYFMTTPSVERDVFLRTRPVERKFCEQTLITIFS